MAKVILDRMPPLIRMSLLDERPFREEYSLTVTAEVSFAKGISFSRSCFFNAVRVALAGGNAVEVFDDEARVWNLKREAGEGALTNLILSSDEQCLVLPDLSVISEDASTRIRSLEEAASDVNLPFYALEEWRNILATRALEDDEVDAFHSDIRDTPVYVERHIRGEIRGGKSSVSSLVPNSRRYFERLVGFYDGSTSIKDYATGEGQKLFAQFSKWRPFEGFLFSLFLSSHSALTNEISVEHLGQEKLVQVFDFVEKHGDLLSLLGALEVGLRILSKRPEVEPFLLRLIHRIRDDNVEDSASEFMLFSALFVLVDGELSRTRLFAEEPPFYRRLASMAQAGLIHRQIININCEIDYEHFSKWSFSNRGEQFYMQSLADMRTEPRWNPELVVAPQIKANFVGRIMIAGNSFKKNIGMGELHDIILGNGEQSLFKLCEFPCSYLPGPLEGTEDSPNVLPDDLGRFIEKQLDTDDVKASSFIALVNSAMIFKITTGHADLAAKALRLGNYKLANLVDKSQLVGILNGLAIVAAVSRNSALADELRILARRYRRDTQYGISIEEAMKMCLIASAARKDLMEWREFAGEWLTELAFGEFEGDEGKVLYSHLKALLHSSPELWYSSARADAALQAWCSR